MKPRFCKFLHWCLLHERRRRSKW